MKCNEVQGNLSAYLDQELSVDEKMLIDNHLADCAICRRELEALQETALMLSSLEEIIPPASFRSELYEKLERDINNGTSQEKKEGFLHGLINRLIGKTRRSVFVPVAISLILLILIVPALFDSSKLSLPKMGSVAENNSAGGAGTAPMDSMYSMQTKGQNNTRDNAEINNNAFTLTSGEREEKNSSEYNTEYNNEVLDKAKEVEMYAASSAAPSMPADGMATRMSAKMAPDSAQPEIQSQITQNESMDKKIIKNAQLNLLVDNYEKATTSIKEKAKVMGGYTQNESLNAADTSGFKCGWIEVRVPQQLFEDFLAEVYTVGKVKNSNTYTQDVTEEYVDVESRLKAMRTKEERLLAILTQQGKLSDILAVENELANTRSELEALQGRLRYLNNRTGYSTININLEQVVVSTREVTTSGLTGVGIRAKEAFIEAINNILLGLGKLIVFLSAALPYLVVATVLILGAWFGLRGKKLNGGD